MLIYENEYEAFPTIHDNYGLLSMANTAKPDQTALIGAV